MTERLFSASSLKTLASCEMKWWFTYLSGLPRPESSGGAALGSEVHRQVEALLKDKNTRQAVHPTAEALYHMCADLEPVAIEKHFRIGRLRGYIDLIAEGNVLVDHKTTKDLKWAKTEEELRTDLQANIYAYWYMEENKVDEVTCRWHYATTTLPVKTRKVQLTLGREEVQNFIDELDIPLADLIEEGKEEPKRNILHCGAFGGCPYAKMCSAGSMEKIKEEIEMVKKETVAYVSSEAPTKEMKIPRVDPLNELTTPNIIPCDTTFTLYINCGSDKVMPAYSYFDVVREDFPGGDYRNVEYGKGRALLAERIREYPLPARLSVDTNTEFGRDVLDVLVDRASEVVRRF